MSIHNLEFMFKPRSVAMIGASEKAGKIGTVLMRNLVSAGFKGSIYPVNPKYDALEGLPACRDVLSLPEAPDLAVIATPPATIPRLIDDLGQRGTRAVVVISAGFGEGENAGGKALEKEMLQAARRHDMRVLGPNCLGIMVPGIGLNASFGNIHPIDGRIAFVTQSGAVLTSVVDWATGKEIGFSHCISLGDMADVDFADMLDYLACDPHTSAILLYVEAIKHARRFMSAARAAARVKPVVAIKVGRHAAASRAALSHTGALAGSDAVYDAAFRRSGILRVDSLDELFGVVETLAMAKPFKGDRLAILTNGGGIGILATDSLLDHGGRLAELSAESMNQLDDLLPPTWSHGNPVDIIGDAPGSRYAGALAVLLKDPGVDAILILNCPLAIVSGMEAATAVVDTIKENRANISSRGFLTAWLGDEAAAPARRLFVRNSIPTYQTPTEAVRAFMHLVRYRRGQEMLTETPPTLPEEFSPDSAAADAIVAEALETDRKWLPQAHVRALMETYGIPAVESWYVETPEEAGALAASLSRSLVLKIESPDITHKSDVGGVALDLDTPEAVRSAALSMTDRVRRAVPGAKIDGFLLQPMIRRQNAFELIVGMTVDPEFGPVLLFGHGGTAVEVVQDKALGLPPLNLRLARDMIHNTRIRRLMEGYREKRAVNIDAVALTLVKISQLVCDLPAIAELDINPLLADEWGVMALDFRVRVAPTAEPAHERLAIRPYPKELEQMLDLPGGECILMRPIRPEDEPAYHEFFGRLPPEDIRLRFMQRLNELPHAMAARLTQIDYDRQMAFVLEACAEDHKGELYGSVQIDSDPGGARAEFAILLRHDMAGKGLGAMLMRRIFDYARKSGIREIYGEVLRENTPMLRLCEAFGFASAPDPEDPGIRLVSLDLTPA